MVGDVKSSKRNFPTSFGITSQASATYSIPYALMLIIAFPYSTVSGDLC